MNYLKPFLFAFILITISSLNAQKSDSIILYFEINEFNLEPNELKKLSQLNNYPSIEKIEINTFCDFLGTYDYNLKLSRKRAETTQNIIKKSVKTINIPIIINAQAFYPGTCEEKRENPNDRGIKEHRVAIVKYYYKNPNTLAEQNEDENINSADNKIITKEIKAAETDSLTIPIVRTGIEDQIVNALSNENENEEELNIKLNNISFQGGTPLFLPEARDALIELLFVMKKYPELKIEIQGHICCQEPEAGDGWDRVNQNYSLSVNRAKAVYDFLIENGIEKERLQYKGFGATKKLYPDESSEYERQQNRRVEIKILELSRK